MRFSFILGSRERPQLLREFLTSIKQTSLNLSQIEALVGCDLDDTDTQLEVPQLEKEFPFVKFFWREREHNLHTYINSLANHATGKYIFGINDDCILLTYGWDEIAWSHLEEYVKDYSDGIVYGRSVCDSIDKIGPYAAFPILSKAAVEAAGCFIPECIRYWGGDVAIFKMYEAIGRICDLPDVRISHRLHNADNISRPNSLRSKMLAWHKSHNVGLLDDLIEFMNGEYSKRVEALLEKTCPN